MKKYIVTILAVVAIILNIAGLLVILTNIRGGNQLPMPLGLSLIATGSGLIAVSMGIRMKQNRPKA